MLKCNSKEVNLLGPKVIQSWYVEFFCRLLWIGYSLFFCLRTHFLQLSFKVV